MLFSSASGPQWQCGGTPRSRGAAGERDAGGRGVGAEEGRLPGAAAPPAQQGQRHLHTAVLAAPRAGGALGGFPVFLVMGGRLLLSVVFFLLFALQEDVVATGSCCENVLKDPRRWMLKAVFIINVPLMFFQTQD